MALEPVTAVLHLGQAQQQLDACRATTRVRSYAVDEGLSRLFNIVLDIDISWPAPFDLSACQTPRAWLGQTVTFGLSRSGHGGQERHWVGVVGVCEVMHVKASGAVGLRLTVVPHLQLLAHERSSEIYIGHSARQILERILSQGLTPQGYRLEGLSNQALNTILEARIRHQESRLDGLHRLMNDFGLGYFVTCEQVTKDDTDDAGSGFRPVVVVFERWQHLGAHLPEAHVVLPLVTSGSGQDSAATESLHQLSHSETLGPRSVVVYSLDPTQAGMPEAVSGTSLRLPGTHAGIFEQAKTGLRHSFDGKAHTGGHEAVRAATLASHLMGEAQAGTSGQSDALGLTPGTRLTVQGGHPDGGTDPDAEGGAEPSFLVTAMRHMGSDNSDPLAEQSGTVAYSNLLELAALPRQTQNNTPTWLTRLPVSEAVPLGLHSATVMGRDSHDELPFVDAAGRILVQVHGMQHSVPPDANTVAGLWVRVAQTWAGAGIGSFFWPRPGFEVLLGFMGAHDGEPMVLGCAYNAVNEPPYNTNLALRSGFKTHKRGNELSFHDGQGREEVKLEATRTLKVTANELMTLQVGFKDLWRRFLAAAGTLEGHCKSHVVGRVPKPYMRAFTVVADIYTASASRPMPCKQSEFAAAAELFTTRGSAIEEVIEGLFPYLDASLVQSIQTCQEYAHSVISLQQQYMDVEHGRKVHTANIFGGSETTVTHDCRLKGDRNVELEVGHKLSATAKHVRVQAASSLALQQEGSSLGAGATVTLEGGEITTQSVVLSTSARQQITIQQGACTITLHGGRVHIRAPQFDVDADDITLKGRKSVTIKSPKTSIY